MNDILREAKDHFAAAIAHPAYGNVPVSHHWQIQAARTREAVEAFSSVEQVILHGQTPPKTGFDHRLSRAVDGLLEAKIRFKLDQIAQVRRGFSPRTHSQLRESVYSDPGTIVTIDGVPYSNMFLTHLYFYQRAEFGCRWPSPYINVLEIGGGYGSLARIFAHNHPNIRYTIVDLPESLFFSEVFLRANLPVTPYVSPIPSVYVTDESVKDIEEAPRLRFVPSFHMDSLADEHFDLVINTFSLQEMTHDAVKAYMNLIQNKISCNYFYSCNYFLNTYKKFDETGFGAGTPMSLILDPWWETKLFQINPPAVRVDADTRNWLEVLLKRVDRSAVTEVERRREAHSLMRELPIHAPGSSEWFAKVWTAAFSGGGAWAYREMLRGIELFNAAGPSVNALYRENAEPKAEDYGEYLYFSKLLEDVEAAKV